MENAFASKNFSLLSKTSMMMFASMNTFMFFIFICSLGAKLHNLIDKTKVFVENLQIIWRFQIFFTTFVPSFYEWLARRCWR